MRNLYTIFITAVLILTFLWSRPAVAIDWTAIKGKDIVLFYPGQSSWESMLSQSDHSGADKFRGGKNCQGCHGGDERSMGNSLVKDKSSEPSPIAGKPGFIVATVKFAHDAERLYVHLDFNPGTQPDAGMDPDFDTKVAMMLDDGGVVEAARAGCWGACHDDSAAMPSAGKADRTKYLARSRTRLDRTGGGDALKSEDELSKIRAQGGFIEYWQARLNPGKPAVAVDGTILEKRLESKSPAVTAEATFAKDQWSVTLSRKLSQGTGYKDILPGRTYSIGFSIHAGHTAKRFHYVSFENTFALDQGSADFVAALK